MDEPGQRSPGGVGGWKGMGTTSDVSGRGGDGGDGEAEMGRA